MVPSLWGLLGRHTVLIPLIPRPHLRFIPSRHTHSNLFPKDSSLYSGGEAWDSVVW